MVRTTVNRDKATQEVTLSSLATDPPGQLDILGHDGHPLGMDGAEVGILKEPNQISLTCLLKSHHSRALEPQVSLEVLSNLTNKPLEWQLTDEQLCRLLVPEHVYCRTLLMLRGERYS